MQCHTHTQRPPNLVALLKSQSVLSLYGTLALDGRRPTADGASVSQGRKRLGELGTNAPVLDAPYVSLENGVDGGDDAASAPDAAALAAVASGLTGSVGRIGAQETVDGFIGPVHAHLGRVGYEPIAEGVVLVVRDDLVAHAREGEVV